MRICVEVYGEEEVCVKLTKGSGNACFEGEYSTEQGTSLETT